MAPPRTESSRAGERARSRGPTGPTRRRGALRRALERVTPAHALAVIGALVGVLAISAAVPEPAHAFGIPGVEVKDLVGKMMKAIFFGGGTYMSANFMAEVTRVPDTAFTGPNVDAGVAWVAGRSRDLSFAALGAILTMSVIHYWAAGVASSQGGGAGVALQGVVRTVGAGLFILAWPWLIDSAVALGQSANLYLFDMGALGEFLKDSDAGYWEKGVSMIFLAVINQLGAILALVLYVTKVGLHAGLVLLAVAMPLAMALWPVGGLAWLPVACLRWITAIIVIFVAWAACLALFATVGVDIFHFRSEGGDGGAWQRSLTLQITKLALLGVMAKIPGMILRTAGLVSGGGGFLMHTASSMASHLASRGFSRLAPDKRGGGNTLAERTSDRRIRLADREHRFDREKLGDNRHEDNLEYKAARDAVQNERYEKREAASAKREEQAAAERALRWSAPPGATTNDLGLHEPYKNRVDAEFRGSRDRLEAGGPPDKAGIKQAWDTLSPQRRLGVQQTVYGVPHGPDPHPSPELTLAQAASADGIDRETRGAYRTLLDASAHPGSMKAFEDATAEPVEPPPSPQPGPGAPPPGATNGSKP